MDAKEIRARISQLEIKEGDPIVVTTSNAGSFSRISHDQSTGQFISYDGTYLLYRPNGEKGRKSLNYIKISNLEKAKP